MLVTWQTVPSEEQFPQETTLSGDFRPCVEAFQPEAPLHGSTSKFQLVFPSVFALSLNASTEIYLYYIHTSYLVNRYFFFLVIKSSRIQILSKTKFIYFYHVRKQNSHNFKKYSSQLHVIVYILKYLHHLVEEKLQKQKRCQNK